MVDPLRREARMQHVPMGRFVCVDDRTRFHDLRNERHAIGFGLGDGRERAPVALARNDHDAALAGLVLRKAAINAVLLLIGGADMAADIGAIDFHRALNLHACVLGSHGFAQLVSEHKGRPILHVEIAPELQGADTFGAVHEDGDSQKVVANRKLAAGEDRARRDRELMGAGFTLPDATGLVGVENDTAAARANGLTAVLGPADLDEPLVGFLVRHTGNGR